MRRFLAEKRFDFVSPADKAFLIAFDQEMHACGYDFGGRIGPGFCWGRFMVVYTKSGVKSKRVYARVYLTEGGLALRFFFTDIDKHRTFIESAPPWMKEVFTGAAGDCKPCHNERAGECQFRKVYTLENRRIAKCNGMTFRFERPTAARIKDYIRLFQEFYPKRPAKKPLRCRTSV